MEYDFRFVVDGEVFWTGFGEEDIGMDYFYNKIREMSGVYRLIELYMKSQNGGKESLRAQAYGDGRKN